jgi:poly-beta-1,6-N-acetyl-D-glucosamine biosynthesis protein PgaD
MKSLIIDRPDHLSLKQRYANNIIRFIAALGWFYLGIPLMTLFNWFLAYTFFNQNLILLEGYKEYQTETSWNYLLIIAGMFISIVLWANFNRFLDYERNKKSQLKAVTTEAMSAYYQVNEEKVGEYRKLKNMTVYFSDDAQINSVSSDKTYES